MSQKAAKQPKVLLVDDEAAILHALGLYLRQEGYSVDAIAKFDHYLASMESKELPDVVVLDILLNHEDGLKIAKEIRDDPKTKHIPIILISALPDGKKLSAKAKADAFLAKPFDVQELNTTIDKLLKRQKGAKRKLLKRK